MENENKGKNLERSAFIGEFIEGSDITRKKKHVEEKSVVEYLELQYTAKAVPEIELIDKQYIIQFWRIIR